MRESFTDDEKIVDRAIASLRETPVPPGPSPELQQRTIFAMSAAKRVDRKWNVVRIAAAIAIMLCGVGIILLAYRSRVEQARIRRDEPKVNTASPRPAPPTLVRADPVRAIPHGPETLAPRIVVASDIAVIGHVFYRGPLPARNKIDVGSCPPCARVIGGTLYDDSLVTNADGTLRNVVVSISSGLPPSEQFTPSQEPVLLDQKGCMFHPHVVAAMVGQSVIVRNSDPLLHSVHSMDAEQTPAFNFAQPTLGERSVEPLQVVETFNVRCDLHPWMNAWVRVFNHPYFAVTDSVGTFAIHRLPPGNYRLKAWHESLGVQEKSFTVRSGSSTIIDFTFEAR